MTEGGSLGARSESFACTLATRWRQDRPLAAYWGDRWADAESLEAPETGSLPTVASTWVLPPVTPSHGLSASTLGMTYWWPNRIASTYYTPIACWVYVCDL